jgi:hypothetical protein
MAVNLSALRSWRTLLPRNKGGTRMCFENLRKWWMLPSSGIQRHVVSTWTDLPHAGLLFGWHSILRMDVLCYTETSVYVRTTWRYTTGDGNSLNYRCENLKSCIGKGMLSLSIETKTSQHKRRNLSVLSKGWTPSSEFVMGWKDTNDRSISCFLNKT